MDNSENTILEEKLKEILELVTKEISDDLLERIIKAQDKHRYGGSGPNDDIQYIGTSKRNQYGTRNVATMTDPDSIPVSIDKRTEEDSSPKKPAEVRASRKRAAEERRQLQIANKMYKPGECMKHMIVHLPSELQAAWYAADAPRELGAAGARLGAPPSPGDAGLVRWTRAGDRNLLHYTDTLEQRSLCVATAEEVAALVASRSLARHVGQAARRGNCQLTLVIFGLRDYFKTAGRRKAASDRPKMTEYELEMALTDMLVTAGCDALKVDTPSDLALALVHFTRAIAEAPYKVSKRRCDERAQFYMRGDNKHCVAVNANGAGAARLWQQMLAVLPMSSLERARALCALYPSPRALMEELQSRDGVRRVADTGVPRAAVPGSRARRTGDEFARKLALLLTSDNGDVLVQ